MANVTAMPVGAFLDTRGNGRALRVSWHHEAAPHGPVVLLSLWRQDLCVASFRLPLDDVPDLIDALRAGMDGHPA